MRLFLLSLSLLLFSGCASMQEAKPADIIPHAEITIKDVDNNKSIPYAMGQVSVYNSLDPNVIWFKLDWRR